MYIVNNGPNIYRLAANRFFKVSLREPDTNDFVKSANESNMKKVIL